MRNPDVAKSRVSEVKTISGFILLLTVLAALPGRAQQLGLPGIDGLSIFYRTGRLSSSPWQAESTSPCAHGWSRTPMCGWGFETTYVLLGGKDKKHTPNDEDATPRDVQRAGAANEPDSKWGAELAVGYDFLNILATTPRGSNSYQVRGSLQTLPSITLYVSRDLTNRVALYAGIGTGLVVLKNVRAYDALGRVYALSGDTWGFTPSIGLIHHLLEENESRPGASVFVEVSYEVRNFPSVAYVLPADVKTLPTDLARSLAASGPVLNVGFEFAFKKKPEKKTAP